MFLIKNDIILLTEYVFLKNNINCRCLWFKIILMNQNEEYLD